MIIIVLESFYLLLSSQPWPLIILSFLKCSVFFLTLSLVKLKTQLGMLTRVGGPSLTSLTCAGEVNRRNAPPTDELVDTLSDLFILQSKVLPPLRDVGKLVQQVIFLKMLAFSNIT